MFIFGSLGYLGYTAYFYYIGQCGRSIEYSIGEFDSQFGISKETFASYVAIAEEPWEKVLGRQLFVYNPEASFKISLIYDERQQTTEIKQKTEFGLTKAESVFKALDAEFNTMKMEYDLRVSAYDEAVKALQANQKDYELRVKTWNARGDISKSQYESLENERWALNNEAERLNNETALINSLTSQLNTLLQKRNLAAQEYNKTARNYNEKYGHGLEFNQAEYVGDMINIYQFSNKKDLTLALAHEFGHALGMDHTENSESIMYYVTSNTVASSFVPSKEDLVELRRVCRLNF